MKIGDIAYNIYVAAVGGAAVLGILYLGVASLSTYIQNNQNDFRGVIEVKGVEAAFKGRRPYNPRMPLPNQDRNGYAEAMLRGNERVLLKYDDLTASSLDGRVMVIDSKGMESEFNGEARYDEKTRIEIDELKDALGIIDPSRPLSEIVEAEIREAIAKR